MATIPKFNENPSSPLPSPPEKLLKGLKWSGILHLILIASLFFKGFFFPSAPIQYIPSLRVDLVGLPDLLKKDLKDVPSQAQPREKAQPEKKARTVPEEAKTDEMSLATSKKKRKEKIQNALARLRAIEKIKDQNEAQSNLYKGNKISKGSTVEGEAKESASPSYLDAVRDRLRSNWSLPIWLARKNLSAQVRIYIDKLGRVRDLNFVRDPGNDQFKAAVTEAIEKSQPFPIPPPEIRSTLLLNGILLGFPL